MRFLSKGRARARSHAGKAAPYLPRRPTSTAESKTAQGEPTQPELCQVAHVGEFLCTAGFAVCLKESCDKDNRHGSDAAAKIGDFPLKQEKHQDANELPSPGIRTGNHFFSGTLPPSYTNLICAPPLHPHMHAAPASTFFTPPWSHTSFAVPLSQFIPTLMLPVSEVGHRIRL